ncbi:MAG TPA: 30S ribosomal protein S20 [Ignavibacteria bacterium]|nr:30S ribosomal protein S20 [Ignavibacteria bacterium]
MANHKSAKKRIRTTELARIRNKAAISKIKTQMKKTLSTSEPAEVEKLYKETVSLLDKSSAKGILKKNNTSHKKSRLTKHLNSVSAEK